MKFRNIGLIALSLIFAGSGCGGGSAGTGAYTSSLPKNTQIKSLSSDDLKELCRSLEAFVHDRFLQPEVACTAAAAEFTWYYPDASKTPEAQCQEADDKCRNQFDNFLSNLDPYQCPIVLDEPSQCTATVAEVEACFNDLFDYLETSLLSLTCSPMPPKETVDDILRSLDFLGPLPETPACNLVVRKCP